MFTKIKENSCRKKFTTPRDIKYEININFQKREIPDLF